MDKKNREKAIKLRLEKELSYSQIMKELSIPKSTLSYWLRDLPLSDKKILELRRKGWQKGEASRERFRNTMRRKKEKRAKEIYEAYEKKMANISRESFFIAGLMLYLGEGDKKNNFRIGLVNTDSKIIRFFIKWMIDFLDVPKDKIRAQLNLYENMAIEKEKKFWKNELGFKNSQFYKPTIRKMQKSSFSYKESYRHGTCGIYVSGVEKKTKIMMATQAFVDKYLEKR